MLKIYLCKNYTTILLSDLQLNWERGCPRGQPLFANLGV